MSCEDSPEITFEFKTDFEKTYLEITPRSMQFDRTLGDFDYCKAKFSEEVAEHIRPHVDEFSVLHQPLPVTVKVEGTPIYQMLWVPEAARFTDGEVHIEFHDPQKSLTRGEVDWSPKNVKLKEAYKHVFKQRDTTGPEILKGIKFTDSAQGYEELVAKYREDGAWYNILRRKSEEYKKLRAEDFKENSDEDLYRFQNEVVNGIEEDNVTNIIDSHAAVDFDMVTPWAAITELNDKFGVDTWVAPDGYLWVGSRSAKGWYHVAAPDDTRVWKLTDYSVTPPRDPVVRSRVRGGWSQDPSESTSEQAIDGLTSLNDGTKDFRMEGLATLDGFDFGQEIVAEVDAKRDMLEDIAKRRMMNKQKEQWKGYIEINPELSGSSFSQVRHAAIGDRIRAIPPDSDIDSECGSDIKDAVYSITGVQHNLDGSNWSMRLDVVPVLRGDLSPENIETELRHYNPSEKKYIEPEEKEEAGFWPIEWFDDLKTTEDYPEIYD